MGSHVATGVVQWNVPVGPPTQKQMDDARRQNNASSATGSKLAPGTSVRLTGLLSAPQLNGKIGICEQLTADGWVRVRVESGELKAIRPENLIPRAAEAQQTSSRPRTVAQQSARKPQNGGITKALA